MKALDINVERTGFPVTIAGEEFFFDCSKEHIGEYREKIEATEKKLKTMNDDDSLSSHKDLLAEGYDVILGEGTFEKLYEKIPDVVAWANALFDLTAGIEKNVEDFNKEIQKKSESLKTEYFKKKNKKKG